MEMFLLIMFSSNQMHSPLSASLSGFNSLGFNMFCQPQYMIAAGMIGLCNISLAFYLFLSLNITVVVFSAVSQCRKSVHPALKIFWFFYGMKMYL